MPAYGCVFSGGFNKETVLRTWRGGAGGGELEREIVRRRSIACADWIISCKVRRVRVG